MSTILRIVILCLGVSLSIWVFMLLVRKKINERNTIVWIGGATAVFLLSIFPEWLDVLASWAGVDYPPSLLFLFSFIILLIISLYQSIQISHLYAIIKEISQFVALQNEKRELEQDSGSLDRDSA